MVRWSGWLRRNSSSRKWRYLAILLASVIVGLVRYWPDDVPARVVGRASVIDGDSLQINGEAIRLAGIDAPESRQMCSRNGKPWACGREATRALRGLIRRHNIDCVVEKLDKYDRLLAVCSYNGSDINAWMVERGWAVSYGDYYDEERRAKTEGRGVWSGTFTEPKDWRDEHLTGSVAAAAS